MIALVGLNHKTASIGIREKFAFSEDDIINFYNQLQENHPINGLVVVATCNRTEIYCDISETSELETYDIITSNLVKFKNYNGNLTNHVYTLADKKVIKHLFRVVTGLDSMLLGEYQIVGQLKTALEISEKYNISGKCLLRLFQKAFETGKLVRTNTKINEGAVTVSYAAVEYSSRLYKNIQEKNILSIGAGETGQLVVAGFLKKKCTKISLANRTFGKAQKVADKLDIKAVELEKVSENLHKFDIVLVSTSSSTPLITANDVKNAMKERDSKNMLLIDLSVPRNIEKDVETIDNVKLVTIDDMQNVVMENYKKRESEIVSVEKIIDEKTNEFMDWISTGKLTPTFLKVSQKFKEINASEMEGFQKNKFNTDYTKAVEYGEHITDKYIRLLIKNIKNVTDNGKKTEYIKLVNELFEL
jgi:glutamyl-tRNA reductase